MTSYRALGVAIVAIGAMGVGTPPEARPREAHNIAWYAAHPAERTAMLKRCRSDMGFSHNTECLNAEAGGDRDYSNRLNARAWGTR